VDNNFDAANSLAILLKAIGHQVKAATNATHAIKIVEIDSFDVFTLDIGLPGMTGYVLAMALRRRPCWQVRPILH
jgi:CheY-like chemotaxis protein